MTGKFTENVHNLGLSTGRILHRLLLSNNNVNNNNNNNINDVLSPSLSRFNNMFSNKNFNLTSSSSSPTATIENITTQSTTLQEFLLAIPTTLTSLLQYILHLPNRYRIWWWDLLHSDPLHVCVETLLIVMCIALVVLQRRSDWRLSLERKKGAPNEEEVEELLREWKEEKRRPLAGDGKDGVIGGKKKRKGGNEVGGGMSGLVVEKIVGSRLYFESGSFRSYNNDNDNTTNNDEDSDKGNNHPTTTTTTNSSTPNKIPPSALNFATHDYLSTTSSPTLRRVARTALHHYGCGSCGPRGFYGTIDAHLEIESAVSSFLHTEGAILYSDGASAATSTVAAFAKRGDLLIVDEGVSESLLVGVTLSRANVRYFRHNDVRDLRRVLEKVAAQDAALARKATDQRRFLVVEGLYRNWGTIAPLEEICKLKEEFCYRLILDDSHGIGTLGKYGRGSLEHAGLKPMVHAEIVTFSLENALGSVGGMTVGSEEVVDHQRLSGAGYCFSASAPPFLSKVCLASVRRLEGRMEEVVKYLEDGDGGDVGEDEEEEESTRKDELSQQPSDDGDELSGPALLTKLHENISLLYTTLTNSSHPHALKLRNRLSITSHPLSPILYLRLADPEATGRTRAEQTSLLDRIAHRCLVKGGVAIVSTGGHVKKYLQSVPEPSLRLVAHANQTREEVEVLVEALGEGVESVLVNNDGNAMD